METNTRWSTDDLSAFLKNNPTNFDYEILIDGTTSEQGDILKNFFINTLHSLMNTLTVSGNEYRFFRQAEDLLYENYCIYDRYLQNRFIDAALTSYGFQEFYEYLHNAIQRDENVEWDSFSKDFIANFRKRFGEENDVRVNHFIPKLQDNIQRLCPLDYKEYPPKRIFHSRRERDKRNDLVDNRLSPSLIKLDNAMNEGKIEMIRNPTSGWDKAGRILERKWAELFKIHFGHTFNVFNDIPVKYKDGKLSPKIDIILSKKDRMHNISDPKTPAYIPYSDVVAAFEVKRTLTKDHITHGNVRCTQIIEDRCKALKKASMDIDDSYLTPFQILRGKVFFGILCGDIENGIENKLLTKRSGVAPIDACRLQKDLAHGESDLNLFPDAILCPHKLLLSKITNIRGGIDTKFVDFKLSLGDFELDKSNTNEGLFFADLRRFLIGQGHISPAEQEDFLGNYSSFRHINSSSNQTSFLIILNADLRVKSRVIDNLAQYFNSRKPNEYSNQPFHHRAPLAELKQWNKAQAQDIIGFVLTGINQVFKNETNANCNSFNYIESTISGKDIRERIYNLTNSFFS